MSSQLLISEAADLLGLTPKALRHYEKLGLITPDRSENGYRVYSANHVLRLLRIRRLQSLGLSLTQIKTLLDEKNDAEVWQTILSMLLEQVQAQLAALEDQRDEIEELLAEGTADVLDVTENLPRQLQPVQEYLDRHLTDAQASLWSREKQFDTLLANSALDNYLVVLGHWLTESRVGANARRIAPVPHVSAHHASIMGQASLTRGEDQR